MEGREGANNVIQKGQCLGWPFPFLNVKINKVFNSYFVFCLLDFSVGLNHLKESAFKEFFKLLSEWLFIFLKNKYDVGITREEYVICLHDNTPVMSIHQETHLLLSKL